MINSEVVPRKWLAAFNTPLLIVRVPDQPTLFQGEVTLTILLLKQSAKNLA